MYLLVIYIPLMSSIIGGLFGRKLGEKGAGMYTSTSIVITFVLSVFIFYEVAFEGSATYMKL